MPYAPDAWIEPRKQKKGQMLELRDGGVVGYEIGFTHHRTILEKAKIQEERLFYINLCARELYSVEALKRAIREDTYRHQGTIANNFTQTLSSQQQALQAIGMFKDEYLLDFMNTEE